MFMLKMISNALHLRIMLCNNFFGGYVLNVKHKHDELFWMSIGLLMTNNNWYDTWYDYTHIEFDFATHAEESSLKH